jgi:hypothetical protein
MRKWSCLLALVAYLAITLEAAFFLPVGARAQGEVELDSVSVLLWPEFDKPNMLVIHEITLSAGTALPQDFDFRIPATGTVQAVAVGRTQETVTDQGIIYDVSTSGPWATVSIKNVSERAIRIEYYNELEKQGTARHYLYSWPGDDGVGSFSVRFQLPVDASGLQVIPALPSSTVGADNLTYYFSEFGSLAAGKTFTLTVDYQKASDTLSASRINAQTAENPATASGRVTLAKYVPWVLGVLGVILILFGLVAGVLYWQGRWRNPGGVTRQRHASRREKPGEPAAVIYCHQCGRRAQPGDLFCRACGTRLRHGE